MRRLRIQGASRVLSTAFHGAYLIRRAGAPKITQYYITLSPICFERLSQTSRFKTAQLRKLYSLTLCPQTTRFTKSLGLGVELRSPTRLDGCIAEWEQPSTKKH